MECKACGNTTDCRSCKALSGAVYRHLFDLFVDSPVQLSAAALHQFLVADPCVVCKVCYSPLNKYGAIKETLKSITSRITSVLSSESNSQVVSIISLLMAYFSAIVLL